MVHSNAILGHFTPIPIPPPPKKNSLQIYTDLKNGPGSWKKSLKSDLSLKILSPVKNIHRQAVTFNIQIKIAIKIAMSVDKLSISIKILAESNMAFGLGDQHSMAQTERPTQIYFLLFLKHVSWKCQQILTYKSGWSDTCA